jgi:hypothetical protein
MPLNGDADDPAATDNDDDTRASDEGVHGGSNGDDGAVAPTPATDLTACSLPIGTIMVVFLYGRRRIARVPSTGTWRSRYRTAEGPGAAA